MSKPKQKRYVTRPELRPGDVVRKTSVLKISENDPGVGNVSARDVKDPDGVMSLKVIDTPTSRWQLLHRPNIRQSAPKPEVGSVIPAYVLRQTMWKRGTIISQSPHVSGFSGAFVLLASGEWRKLNTTLPYEQGFNSLSGYYRIDYLPED